MLIRVMLFVENGQIYGMIIYGNGVPIMHHDASFLFKNCRQKTHHNDTAVIFTRYVIYLFLNDKYYKRSYSDCYDIKYKITN